MIVVGVICSTCGQYYSPEEYHEIIKTAHVPCGHSQASLTELIRYPLPGITTKEAANALTTAVRALPSMKDFLPRHSWNEKPEMLYADPEWKK